MANRRWKIGNRRPYAHRHSWTARTGHLLAVAVLVALASNVLAQEPPPWAGLGRPPTTGEQRDSLVGPDGLELPEGSGTATVGQTVYTGRGCGACHGPTGREGPAIALVGGEVTTRTNYWPIAHWPFAPSIWDYIRRAMPYDNPGTLTVDEVYAVTAYLLYRNGIIAEDDVIDATSLPMVQMPARESYQMPPPWTTDTPRGFEIGSTSSGGAQCEAVGDIQFICDLLGPEDLAILPGGKWVIASGNQEGGRLHAIDVNDKTTTVLFPTETRHERLDAVTYPTCPGPLDLTDPNAFRAHGLYLATGSDDTHTLYVVHHGTRESIEVFAVDGSQGPPALTWVGCAVAPEPLGLNSVVALPQEGFVATSPGTGDVWEWHTDAGWTQVPGSDDTAPNGLEISPDGDWLYVAGWREEKLTRLSRGRNPVDKTVVDIGFRPDNLRLSSDGTVIYAAGHGNYRTPEETSNVAIIDPATLAVTRIFQHIRIDGFEASTTAVRIGDEMWLGTNRGRMIAYFPAP